MKKIVLTLATILLAISAWAVPAKPGVFTYTQPDGSVVRLERHGDEFYNWTTIAGTTQAVELDQNGYWRKTTLDPTIRKAALQRRMDANELRLKKASRPMGSSTDPMTHGPRHIPVILVAFSDLPFSISDPNAKFTALLNQSGYSANGGTGSVQDFYLDNSNGVFQPIFDVFGPVTLPHDMKYYGEAVKDAAGNIIRDDEKAPEALRDGCRLLNDQIDFTQYDYDNDGVVDMTLFYYSGYNPAEWGPDDAIWPHQSSVNFTERFDGMRLGRYFCTSELKGRSGTNMCGIGTTCHEFGHSLGLPDFYDTDYDDNGSCSALGYFSTMCSGAYLNNGCTPPYFNSEERIFLGWLEDSDVPNLPAGQTAFGSVKNGIAYRTQCDTEGEYFLYECRDGSGWDKYLPTGLVISHVDKRTSYMVDRYSAADHWNYWEYFNDINAYGDHPLFYIIPAYDQTTLNANEGALSSWVFPGSSNVTEYTPVDWDGNSNVGIIDISYSGGKVSLNTQYVTEKTIMGKVTDLSGNALAGAKVVLTSISSGSSAAPGLRKVPTAAKTIEATTGADGSFTMGLGDFTDAKGHITCSKEGYKTTGMDIALDSRLIKLDLKLRGAGQGDYIVYSYYDPSAQHYIYGDRSYTSSQMGAIRIPASSIPEKGGTLTSFSFQPIWDAEAYYLVVDAGKERLYTVELSMSTGAFQTVDLSSYHLTIPAGKDIYVGFAYKNVNYSYSGYDGYMFYVTMGGNNCYTSAFSVNSSNWNAASQNLALAMEVQILETIDSSVDYPDMNSFLDMGICTIADPKNGKYSTGETFSLNLQVPQGVQVTQTTWSFDGKSASNSVKLTRGTHTVSAAVKYADGSEETLELKITVK